MSLLSPLQATNPKSLAYRPNLDSLYAAQDDMAAYAEGRAANFAPIKPTDYDALVTHEECRETTLRRMVSSQDQCDAVEWLVARGEIAADLAERIEQVSLEWAEKRMNRGSL